MSTLLISQSGAVVTLTLNNPEELNALSAESAAEFAKTIQSLKKDKSARVVVITGSGRGFCSGARLQVLDGLRKKTPATAAKFLKNFYGSFLSVRDLPQPVIAAINGPAVGAGCCLALACDLRYAANSAKMALNFARLGLPPGMGGLWRLARLAGEGFAAEMLYTGDLYSADRLLAAHVLNGVYPDSTFLTDVQTMAQKIAAGGPMALQRIKKELQLSETKPLAGVLPFEAQGQTLCTRTSDFPEGIAAAREKRAPRFTGK